MAAESGGRDGSSAEFMFKSGVFRLKFQLVSRLSHGKDSCSTSDFGSTSSSDICSGDVRSDLFRSGRV
ncbi:hypothetical protein Hanom_Chr01g00060241 [Helianthus anomalus]